MSDGLSTLCTETLTAAVTSLLQKPLPDINIHTSNHQAPAPVQNDANLQDIPPQQTVIISHPNVPVQIEPVTSPSKDNSMSTAEYVLSRPKGSQSNTGISELRVENATSSKKLKFSVAVSAPDSLQPQESNAVAAVSSNSLTTLQSISALLNSLPFNTPTSTAANVQETLSPFLGAQGLPTQPQVLQQLIQSLIAQSDLTPTSQSSNTTLLTLPQLPVDTGIIVTSNATEQILASSLVAPATPTLLPQPNLQQDLPDGGQNLSTPKLPKGQQPMPAQDSMLDKGPLSSEPNPLQQFPFIVQTSPEDGQVQLIPIGASVDLPLLQMLQKQNVKEDSVPSSRNVAPVSTPVMIQPKPPPLNTQIQTLLSQLTAPLAPVVGGGAKPPSPVLDINLLHSLLNNQLSNKSPTLQLTQLPAVSHHQPPAVPSNTHTIPSPGCAVSLPMPIQLLSSGATQPTLAPAPTQLPDMSTTMSHAGNMSHLTTTVATHLNSLQNNTAIVSTNTSSMMPQTSCVFPVQTFNTAKPGGTHMSAHTTNMSTHIASLQAHVASTAMHTLQMPTLASSIPTMISTIPTQVNSMLSHAFTTCTPTQTHNISTFSPSMSTHVSNLPTQSVIVSTHISNLPTHSVNMSTHESNLPTYSVNMPPPTTHTSNLPVATKIVSAPVQAPTDHITEMPASHSYPVIAHPHSADVASSENEDSHTESGQTGEDKLAAAGYQDKTVAMATNGPSNTEQQKMQIFCTVCNKLYPEGCEVHTTDTVYMEDEPILTLARASLPKCFYLQQTSTSDIKQFLGVWCKSYISERTLFGPVLGELKTIPLEDYRAQIEGFNPFRISVKDDHCTVLHLRDETLCNWVMFVRTAHSLMEQNCVLYQDRDCFYLITTTEVKEEEELLMWFSADICKQLEISQDPENTKLLQCNICGLYFTTKKLRTAHLKASHPDRYRPDWTCPMCAKTYSSNSKLNNHMMLHMGLKPYSCHFCNKQFADSSNLKTHVLIHTGQKKYACETCNKTFRQKAHLDAHLVIHTGDKKHICTYCEKAFARLSDLKTHTYQHTQEMQYTCSLCGKQFYKSQNYKKHLKEMQYTCSLCGKQFYKSQNYKKHLKVHSGERNYMCSKCFKGFQTKYHRDRHLKICREKNTKDEESTFVSLQEVTELGSSAYEIPLKSVAIRRDAGGGATEQSGVDNIAQS